MRKNPEIPLYGTIPLAGKTWSVTFRYHKHEHGGETMDMNGYGDFPFDRFPNIPIVRCDLAGLDSVLDSLKGSNYRSPQEAVGDSWGGHPTLTEYLTARVSFGIPVDNYAG